MTIFSFAYFNFGRLVERQIITSSGVEDLLGRAHISFGELVAYDGDKCAPKLLNLKLLEEDRTWFGAATAELSIEIGKGRNGTVYCLLESEEPATADRMITTFMQAFDQGE